MTEQHHEISIGREDRKIIKPVNDWFHVATCVCGWTYTSRNISRVTAAFERHSGQRFSEVSLPDAEPVSTLAVTRKQIALPALPKHLHGHALERANICGDCAGPLRDGRGAYRTRVNTSGMTVPVCNECVAKSKLAVAS